MQSHLPKSLHSAHGTFMRQQPIQGGRAGASEEESTSAQDAGSQAKLRAHKADSVRFMCYLGLLARAGRQPNPPQRDPTGPLDQCSHA